MQGAYLHTHTHSPSIQPKQSHIEISAIAPNIKTHARANEREHHHHQRLKGVCTDGHAPQSAVCSVCVKCACMLSGVVRACMCGPCCSRVASQASAFSVVCSLRFAFVLWLSECFLFGCPLVIYCQWRKFKCPQKPIRPSKSSVCARYQRRQSVLRFFKCISTVHQ